MICHLAALSGYFIPLFGNILGPLIVWAIKKDEYAFVDEQGKEAINFQLSLTIPFLVSFALAFVVIGFFMMAVLSIYALAMIIIASIKTNDGIHYHYPLSSDF